MAQKKIDGVVEAVRYSPTGQVEIVRVYERRGPTYSDRILLTRQELIERLKAKKKFFAGRRMPYLASTFDVTDPVTLTGSKGKEFVVAGKVDGDKDRLDGVPLF